jgi:type I restriction enzyme R subunit
VREAIRRFEEGQLGAASLLEELERVARELEAEAGAHLVAGLPERAYGVYRILEAYRPAVGVMGDRAGGEYEVELGEGADERAHSGGPGGGGYGSEDGAAKGAGTGAAGRAGSDGRRGQQDQRTGLSALEQLAVEIDAVYASNETAPVGWHLKEQLRKELRQQVRALVFPARLQDWKEIPARVEEYALRVYLKG